MAPVPDSKAKSFWTHVKARKNAGREGNCTGGAVSGSILKGYSVLE